MDRRLWDELYALVTMPGKHHDFARRRYSDACIALVYLWSVVRDRPRCWACEPLNWDGRCPWEQLPSPSRLSRRLRTVPVLGLVRRAEAWLRDRFPDHGLALLDAKPLPVGGASKDRDARCGRSARGRARGYKVHAVASGSGRAFDAWRLSPMSAPTRSRRPGRSSTRGRCARARFTWRRTTGTTATRRTTPPRGPARSWW